MSSRRCNSSFSVTTWSSSCESPWLWKWCPWVSWEVLSFRNEQVLQRSQSKKIWRGTWGQVQWPFHQIYPQGRKSLWAWSWIDWRCMSIHFLSKKYSIIAWTLHFKRLGRSRFDLVWLFSEFWISIWKLQSEHDTESSYNLASLQGLLWHDTKIHEIHQWWICRKHSL